MTNAELFSVLSESGIPFVDHEYDDTHGPIPSAPYGVFTMTSENAFYADGMMYFRTARYQVELYTKRKDPAAEKQVEDTLAGSGIAFEKSEAYVQNEKLYQILYEIEV